MGRLGCELDFWPKMKFEARELLFIFNLEIMVIRALRQWLIKPQVDSVNDLTRFKPCSACAPITWSKHGQTDPNLLDVLLQDVNSNFSIWLNMSFLTKI